MIGARRWWTPSSCRWTVYGSTWSILRNGSLRCGGIKGCRQLVLAANKAAASPFLNGPLARCCARYHLMLGGAGAPATRLRCSNTVQQLDPFGRNRVQRIIRLDAPPSGHSHPSPQLGLAG